MDSDEERNWVYCGMIKLLGSFLKEKRGDICLYIGFIGVFYVIFSLSNLPVDAVNYAFFLSAIWLLGYGIFKFHQYYKNCVVVIEAKQRLEEVMENLPATRSYIELEYQAIIQNMYKKMSELQSAERIGRQEMKDYYIKTKDLSVGYQGKVLIRDINLDIKKGEIVTLIGPNGAGKSTILKSVTRQLKLIGGEVYLDSDEIRKLSYKSMARKVAVMLTERMKPELMTCHDVVATGRYPYTGRLGVLSGEDENKVDEALMAVHAQELGIRNFLEISDGQRQRILLARAICQEPEVMILDEPTSYLDIRHKLELLEILRKMAKEKEITVIMSLHEIDLAQKISDKVVCVKGDRIAGFGNPEEIFTEEKIRELYGIDNGYYDPCFGSVELPRVVGKPEVFVLSSCGTGIPVYRKLQKAGIPFAAGILYPGECDYQLARLLASEIISEEPYEPISCETYRKALEMMEQCKKVINAGVKTGKMNQKAEELLKIAEERGMLI